jgi:hypothetical protein
VLNLAGSTLPPKSGGSERVRGGRRCGSPRSDAIANALAYISEAIDPISIFLGLTRRDLMGPLIFRMSD